MNLFNMILRVLVLRPEPDTSGETSVTQGFLFVPVSKPVANKKLPF